MLLENVQSCPVCSGSNFKQIHSCKDYTSSGEVFHVEQCAGCGLLLTNPRPSAEHASSYYLSNNYISHGTSGEGLINRIYLIIRGFQLRWKFNLVNNYLLNNSLLDIGCGTGSFLHECKKHGIETFGMEPSIEASDKAPAGITIVNSMEQVPEIDFGVITLWHVLEHAYDLNIMFEQIKKRLSNHGTIFIAVPNWESDDARHYQADWAAYDVPRHAWHFSKETMQALLKKSGLKLRGIVPLKFDSYYISLLSEKNKSGGVLTFFGLIKSLFIGLRSNMRAKKTMNYSSLVYLVQK